MNNSLQLCMILLIEMLVYDEFSFQFLVKVEVAQFRMYLVVHVTFFLNTRHRTMCNLVQWPVEAFETWDKLSVHLLWKIYLLNHRCQPYV
jgi:hypothetical protein